MNFATLTLSLEIVDSSTVAQYCLNAIQAQNILHFVFLK